MTGTQRRLGGREATAARIDGDFALAVGKPDRRLPEGWTWQLLTELARLESGHTPSRRRPDYWGGDVPWIGIRDATANHGRTITATAENTNSLGIANSAARILPKDTVCLSRTASVGYVVVMGRPMATSQDFVNWTCSERLDFRFLKYVLMAEGESLLRFASGSVHQTIYFPEVKSFHVATPPLREQQAIAELLGSLDDKIELNRRMNETLGAMAQAIFSDWLRRSGTRITRARIGELVAEGVIVIGDGYRAKNEELFGPGLPFIRAGELDTDFDVQAAATLNERSVLAAGHKRSLAGDVAFTSKGTIGRFARVTAKTPAFVYSPQVCFWRTQNAQKLRPEILYLWMIGDDLRGQIDAVAGQTDMAPYVSLRDQRSMTMPQFGSDQHTVADTVKPLLDRQAVNAAESRTLAATRDLLLPKLMSGEIRLGDAQAQLEAAQ